MPLRRVRRQLSTSVPLNRFDQIRRVATLAAATAVEDGVVVLAADWGGSLLVVARAAVMACDEATLRELLDDLDELSFPQDDLQGNELRFLRAPGGAYVGPLPQADAGEVTEAVWVHPGLVQAGLEAGVRAVIAGDQTRIPEPDPPVEPHERESILRAYRKRLPASRMHFGWDRPDGWSRMHSEALQRRSDEEIPPRADGQRWYGVTVRGVVRHAGLASWARDQ